MKKNYVVALLGLFFIFSCKQAENKEVKVEKDTVIVENSSNYLTMATLWFQNSAEAAAIYQQTYNWAKIKLDQRVKANAKSKKKLAIITDLDETALDNSPFQAKLIKENQEYSDEAWNSWVREKRAKALPGALAFFKYAKEIGIQVFYVSNRQDNTLEETIENMKNLEFPYTEKEYYLLKAETSDKTARRNKVLENYNVILYLGDNLLDFDEIFAERAGEDLGRNVVETNKAKFGDNYIVFPNPMYGAWEKAIYGGSYKHSQTEKADFRLDLLKQ